MNQNIEKTAVRTLEHTPNVIRTMALVAFGVGVGALATVGFSASAFGGGAGERGCDSEKREAMHEALENRDYNTWQELVEGQPIANKITEENFDTFVELHEAMEAGEWEKANELRQTLGLGGLGFRKGHMGRGW